MARRSGLGKGLDALIPTGSGGTPPTGGSLTGLREISVTSVHPNPNQPRVHFDEEALAELTSSVRAIGVLQPILVRPRGDNEFELIAGERRWRAATRAGLSTIPAIVRVTDDVSSVEQALVENLHRLTSKSFLHCSIWRSEQGLCMSCGQSTICKQLLHRCRKCE
ncbi:MAG: ParB/RepB/Spo0J family partition protein, partial [Actinobacteria bacterium]|nr:ParB/RepB/Spo0J family partition protein [Actinomycetota bacterium]